MTNTELDRKTKADQLLLQHLWDAQRVAWVAGRRHKATQVMDMFEQVLMDYMKITERFEADELVAALVSILQSGRTDDVVLAIDIYLGWAE